MRRKRSVGAVLSVALLLLGAVWGDNAIYGQTGTATIATDRFDYVVTDNVAIGGSGFTTENVQLVINQIGTAYIDNSLTGAGPGFSLNWNPPDTLRGTFLLTATGLTSGRVAKTIFTIGLQKVVDDKGADDLSGQKDLNFLTIDYGTPGSQTILTTWGWDDTAWSGNNTGDACTLFDVSGDGDADYSLCVTVGGTPAAYMSTRMYRCGPAPTFLGARSDRCTQPTLVTTPIASSGADTRPVHNSDPFGNPNSPQFVNVHTQGNKCSSKTGTWPCVPDDVVALLKVQLSDFNQQQAKLINICSYPSQEPNSDPSDCVVTPNSGFLTIVKKSSPTGNEAFVFNASAAAFGQGSSFTVTTSADLGGSVYQGQRQFLTYPQGTLDYLREAVPAGWTLSKAGCIVDGPNTLTGTSEVPNGGVAGGSAVNKGITGVSIVEGLETICTFEDTRDPSVTLTKTVIDNYSSNPALPGAWTLQATNKSTSEVITFTTGAAKHIAPGTYTLSESNGPSGYVPGMWSCSPKTLINGELTIAAGDAVSCSITNTAAAATLIVKKVVVNDNGGTLLPANFSFTVSGVAGTFSFDAADADDVANPAKGSHSLTNLAPGTYSVSETAAQGYGAPSYSGDCQNVVLALGQTKTCTITNNDSGPSLHLRKTVVNNNGGTALASAWTLTATGTGGSPSNLSGQGSVDSQAGFKADTYALAETGGPTGYTASAWNCGGAQMPDATHVIVPLAGNVTCTITNNDNEPKLHLRKTVTNDSGGGALATAWTLAATGTVASPTNLSGGTPVDSGAGFKADTYALAETGGPTGYTAGPWNCGAATMPDTTHVVVPLGAEITCTINNNDNEPALHLRKTVTNDNGGTAVAAAWTLTATGSLASPTSLTGQGSVDSAAGFKADTYALNETGGPAGYAAGAWNCGTATMTDATHVVVPLGGNVTCTINNDDVAPSLTLIKQVDTSTGGNASPSAWTLTATGALASPSNLSGQTPVASGSGFKADTYTIGENSGPVGYTPTYSCVKNGVTTTTNTITLGLAESATCTITNKAAKQVIALATTQWAILWDRATVSSIRANAPDRPTTATFQLFSEATCQVAAINPDTLQPYAALTVALTYNQAGTGADANTGTGLKVAANNVYYWKFVYAGDSFNEAKSSCQESTDIKFVNLSAAP